MKGSASGRESLPRKTIYALIPATILFLSLEAGLRLGGFEFYGTPRHISFGPNVSAGLERNVIEEDPSLFWRLRWSDEAYPFLEGKKSVRRGPPQVRREHPEGRALLALGDSCTFFGEPPYIVRAAEFLRAEFPDIEAYNAGVPGYTSLQGLRWFREELKLLEAEWVSVYFGWNDHWRALQRPDHEVALPETIGDGTRRSALESLRLVQAGRALQARLRTPPLEKRPLRVPAQQYRENLLSLCRDIQESGGRPILITAPAALTAEHAGRLFELGYVSGPGGITGLHENYNSIVRQTARDCGAALADLAASPRPRELLMGDGIHLSEGGMDRLARMLASLIKEESHQ